MALGGRLNAESVTDIAMDAGHVVIVGCGRVGGHIVGVLGEIGVPVHLAVGYELIWDMFVFVVCVTVTVTAYGVALSSA